MVAYDDRVEVTTVEQWEAAQEMFDWFHDAATRSFAFLNDQRVLPGGSMEMGHGEGVLRVVVQTQSSDQPGGEIIFRGVHSLEYDRSMDVQPGELTSVRNLDGEFLRFRFGECVVLARSASMKPLDWATSEIAHLDPL
jgi:hypothetical protein